MAEHTPLFGGTGGSPFDDTQAPGRIARIVALTIRSGSMVDSIQATYQLENGQIWAAPVHGGGGGSPHTISFMEDETISTMLLRTGSLVDQIMLITTRPGEPDHVYGPYGGQGGSSHAITGNIVAFYGRSGSLIDAVGVYGNNLSWGETSTSSTYQRLSETTGLEAVRAA